MTKGGARISAETAQFWNPKRLELQRWFQRKAPSLENAYITAVILAHEDGLPARRHLLCHLVRDILDVLPKIVVGEIAYKPATPIYKKHLDGLDMVWPDQLSSKIYVTDGYSDGVVVEVPIAAAEKVNELLALHRERQEADKPSVELARSLVAKYSKATSAEHSMLADRLQRCRNWFVARAHLEEEILDRCTASELFEKFELFENTLHSIVCNFFTGTAELDEILEQANN